MLYFLIILVGWDHVSELLPITAPPVKSPMMKWSTDGMITERGKMNCSEKSLSQCDFFQQKSTINCLGAEPGLPQ
jgi:hypothetical protein